MLHSEASLHDVVISVKVIMFEVQDWTVPLEQGGVKCLALGCRSEFMTLDVVFSDPLLQ